MKARKVEINLYCNNKTCGKCCFFHNYDDGLVAMYSCGLFGGLKTTKERLEECIKSEKRCVK